MAKRDRDILIRFFVTSEEKAVIQRRMELVRYTNMSEYLRKISMDGYLINVDYTYIKEMNAELSAIGRNINQIAARANSTGIIYADDIVEIKNKQEEIWQLQKSILSSLR
ncbi:MAG TPA: plasmid mobilization relaxosome protein MobC [Oscillospiraceae bacterium]|nr:plasmid mobilization relaxosome protein MobC [Oscillospiraceae bacterium]